MDLRDRVGLITGSGRGIGRGIAIKFAQIGANTAVVDKDIETAEDTASEIRKIGRKAIAIQADVTNRKEVTLMVNQVIKEFGGIDILVNNVGWDNPMPFIQKSPELCDKIIDVNLKSTIICSRAVIEHMIEKKKGKIVNIASDAGRLGIIP